LQDEAETREKQSWPRRWRVTVGLIATGLFFALIPVVLENAFPHPNKLTSIGFEFLDRLGDALLVAAFLWIAIEKGRDIQGLRDVVKSLLINFFGALLPSDLRTYIDDYLRTSLVRTQWDIIYDVEHASVAPDYLLLTIRSTYIMQNFSERSTDYNLVYQVEESQFKAYPTEITSVEVASASLDLAGKIERNAKGYVKLRQPLPFRLPPGGTESFSTHSRQYFKRTITSAFWAKYPVSKGATFTINYPGNEFDIYFDVTAGEEIVPHPDADGKKTWTTSLPILPGQGFSLRIHTKR
jgi:hypothetical protein